MNYEEVTYDANDNVLTERRRDGQVVTNTYDALNRLRTKAGPGLATVTHSYNNFDLLLSAASTPGTISWTYSALGRVLTEVQPNGTVGYQYDAAGNRTRLTYPGTGFQINYDYGSDSSLWRIRENGATSGVGVLATYVYDAAGRRSSLTRGNGGVTGYSHDGASRLVSLGHTVPTGGSSYNGFTTLAYNPANQIISQTLTNVSYQWSGATPGTTGYAVNGLNQYTSVGGQAMAHDARGNMTNDGTKTYAYDLQNRLTSSTNGTALTWDSTSRLYQVSQGSTTTRFLYDGSRLIAEYSGTGTLLRRYVHGGGVDEPLVWYEGTGTSDRRWLYADERGSIIGVESGGGFAINRHDEYGQPAASNTGRFGYTGQAWLPELQLWHYKARAYSPRLGRFMQTDPIGTKDQINLYAYVGNDPLNKTDPTGLECTNTEELGPSCKVDTWNGEPINRDELTEAELANLAKVEKIITSAYIHALKTKQEFSGKFFLAGNKDAGVKNGLFSAAEMVYTAENTGIDFQTAGQFGSPNTGATYQPAWHLGQKRQLTIYPPFLKREFSGEGVGAMTREEVIFHEWIHGTSAQSAWNGVRDQSIHQAAFNWAAREFARGRPFWYPLR